MRMATFLSTGVTIRGRTLYLFFSCCVSDCPLEFSSSQVDISYAPPPMLKTVSTGHEKQL